MKTQVKCMYGKKYAFYSNCKIILFSGQRGELRRLKWCNFQNADENEWKRVKKKTKLSLAD